MCGEDRLRRLSHTPAAPTLALDRGVVVEPLLWPQSCRSVGHRFRAGGL